MKKEGGVKEGNESREASSPEKRNEQKKRGCTVCG